MEGLEVRNQAWLNTALEIGTKATASLLEEAKIKPKDIHLFASTTVTGLAVPTIESRIMNQLDFSSQTKRMPFFGLGCLAGVAGINRVADYLVAYPDQAAIFLSIELCSLTLQKKDVSMASLVSSGLFGDGCAAVLLVGDKHPLHQQAPLKIEAWQSHFFPKTEKMMGWDIVDDGFKVVLSNKVPKIAALLPEIVDNFCQSHNSSDISFYVAHPGGPKVLKSLETAFEFTNNELQLSWQNLQKNGNISSTSVLLILQETIRNLVPSTNGLMLAMGPGFCAEMTLLKSMVGKK
jgi:alkylresorcinol/alkylpyrone synthase